jgi:ferredoxin-NADP reductase
MSNLVVIILASIGTCLRGPSAFGPKPPGSGSHLHMRKAQSPSRHFSQRAAAAVAVAFAAAAQATLAFAQVAAGDHAAHHPPPATTGPAGAAGMSGMKAASASTMGAASKAAPAAGSGMGGMMGDMMTPSGMGGGSGEGAAGCCGPMGPKPFYASMMDFPKLTDEARARIRPEALTRLGSGSQAVTAGQAALHRAQAANDAAAALIALRDIRGGLSLAESGAGALQALGEGQPPAQTALTWFRQEMALPTADPSGMAGGFRGLSSLHVLLMALLGAALAGSLWLQWIRARRVGALARRLTPGAPVEPSPASSPGAATGPGVAAVARAAEEGAPARRPWIGVLRIKAIFDETPGVKTFRLMEPNLGPFPFTFLPGQYATVTSEIDGKKVRRSYTISSSPTQRDYIELTVKREQYGLESRHLHDHVDPGDLIEIAAPAGSFFFTGQEAEGIVLIAGGVGITPMMSVLRYLTDRAYPHDIHLLYGVRTPADVIFREELDHLARRHPRLHVTIVVSQPEGTDWTGPVGFMTPEFITATVPEIDRRRIHLCGPPAMMEAVKGVLQQLNVPPDQVKTENFAPPKGGPVLETQPPPAAVTAVVDVGAAWPSAPPSAQATVTFSKSGKSGRLAPDQSVLEAAEAIGVAIDYECRVGVCGRCKVPLRQGSVSMEVQDSLTEGEKRDGLILACQAKSIGDLVVDA